jgi:hypothetical protein
VRGAVVEHREVVRDRGQQRPRMSLERAAGHLAGVGQHGVAAQRVDVASSTWGMRASSRSPRRTRASQAGDAAGRRSVNVAPAPATLSTSSRPPMRRISCRLIASPSPVPPVRRFSPPSTCTNGSKMRSCCSGGMPMPVSRTAIDDLARARRVRIEHRSIALDAARDRHASAGRA